VEFVTDGNADEDAADEKSEKKEQERMWGSCRVLRFKGFGCVSNRGFDVLRGVGVGLTL